MTEPLTGILVWAGVFVTSWIGFVVRLVHGPFRRERHQQKMWDEMDPDTRRQIKVSWWEL